MSGMGLQVKVVSYDGFSVLEEISIAAEHRCHCASDIIFALCSTHSEWSIFWYHFMPSSFKSPATRKLTCVIGMHKHNKNHQVSIEGFFRWQG